MASKQQIWRKNDFWLTPNFQIFKVVSVKNGMASLVMIHPLETCPATQKPIPVDWVKVSSAFVQTVLSHAEVR